jgi:hypothetical protein
MQVPTVGTQQPRHRVAGEMWNLTTGCSVPISSERQAPIWRVGCSWFKRRTLRLARRSEQTYERRRTSSHILPGWFSSPKRLRYEHRTCVSSRKPDFYAAASIANKISRAAASDWLWELIIKSYRWGSNRLLP